MTTGAPLNLPLIESSERSPEVAWAEAMNIINTFAATIETQAAAITALQTQIADHETRIDTIEEGITDE